MLVYAVAFKILPWITIYVIRFLFCQLIVASYSSCEFTLKIFEILLTIIYHVAQITNVRLRRTSISVEKKKAKMSSLHASRRTTHDIVKQVFEIALFYWHIHTVYYLYYGCTN